MKKIIVTLTTLALVIFALTSCGGGAGSPSSPSGENHGTPSIVQLQPSHFVAQTNTSITLHAKVLDGNGAPVASTLVTFTNLSPIGVLSSTTAETNNTGIATVTLKSTFDGFSTVQAEVSKDVGLARDRKTMFFSSFNTEQPPTPQTPPSLTLSVDDGDGIPNETNDFVLTNAIDNQRLITATVSVGGAPVKGSKVTFGSDRAFKVGTEPTCSDGSAICEVTFPQGNTATTNDFGDATVLVEVKPAPSSFIEAPLNITALADDGAFNLVTLLLEPVQSVKVFANPPSVASGGTSTITAQALIKGGIPVSDGTTVNFKVTQGTGGIDPFAQTTNGIATAKFTAPTLAAGDPNEIDLITASVGGVTSAPTTVTVIAPAAPPPTPTPDTTKPTVSSSIPTNGGTLDISNAGGNPVPVSITFSENIDCSTVTIATITITPSVTDWTLTSCSGPNVVFRGTLTGTSYSVNVGTGVKDLAGNVAVALVFTFTVVP